MAIGRHLHPVLLVLGGSLLAGVLPVACGARFEGGDRVEVNRGLEWVPGTVIGFSRSRVEVRLDDDGSASHLPADVRERRLTRTYSPSDLRRLHEAAPASSTPAVAAPSVRTWSDATGRFSLQATYGGLNGEKAVLGKLDGSRIEVPLAKLSATDQEPFLS